MKIYNKTYQKMSTGRKKERPWRARARAQSVKEGWDRSTVCLGYWPTLELSTSSVFRNPVRQCVKQVAWERKKKKGEQRKKGGKRKARRQTGPGLIEYNASPAAHRHRDRLPNACADPLKQSAPGRRDHPVVRVTPSFSRVLSSLDLSHLPSLVSHIRMQRPWHIGAPNSAKRISTGAHLLRMVQRPDRRH